jgi:PKD repeat protein
MEKGLACGIILLFVGTSVVPSITGNIDDKKQISPYLNEDKGRNILLYNTYDGGIGYDNTFCDETLPNILQNHGYSITLKQRTTTPQITNSLLATYDELWLVSADYESPGCFIQSEIDAILNFRQEGKGLLLMSDHEEYCNDVNQIANLFGVNFYGNANHYETVIFDNHPLFSSVNSIYIYSSEAYMSITPPVDVVATCQGDNLIAVFDDGNGRIVFDRTWLQLDDVYINTGDTSQYICNIADWLSGGSGNTIFFDDFNSWDPSKWKTYSDPTVSVSNGELTLTETTGQSGYLVSKVTIPMGTKTEIRFKQVQHWDHIDSQFAALDQDTGTGVSEANQVQAWDSNYQDYWRFWTQRDGSGPGSDNLGGCPDVFSYHTIKYVWLNNIAQYYFDNALIDVRTENVPYIDLNVVFRVQQYNSIIIDWVNVTEFGGGGNQPPVADFSWAPQNPNPSQTVAFDASGSHDPDGTITLYEWDWNNDGVYEESHTTPVAAHSWPQASYYLVTLRVTDNGSTTDTVTKTLIVGGGNQPPVANAGGSYSANVGVSITFDGSHSHDPDGSIVGYQWDFNNDGSWDTGWLTSPTYQYTFYSQFHGYVKLKVKDNLGATSTATAKIDVGKANQPPVADFSWNPSSPKQGQTITFDASASYDPDGSITKYEWDWNSDGTYEESRTTPTTTHSWSNTGTYTVTLRVTDNSGTTKTKAKQVTVSTSGPPPFNPPSWVTKLMSITGVHETWKGDYWYVKIPFNLNYLPSMDYSFNTNAAWPFGGLYHFAFNSFNSYLEVKIYPSKAGTNSYTMINTAGNFAYMYPFSQWDQVRIVTGCDLRDGSWDDGDVFIKGDVSAYLFVVSINGVIWIIPYTVNLQIGAAGGFQLNILNPNGWGGNNYFRSFGYIGLRGTLKGGIGFNLGWWIRASVGVYGTMEGGIRMPPIPPSWYFKGEIGLYGEIGPWEGRIKVWPKSYNLDDNFEWQLIQREYGESQWQGGNRGVLLKEVFPFAQPSIANHNDQKMMVWVYDNLTKQPLNGYDLSYSIWNGVSWRIPKDVTNDNYNEMYPSVVLLDNGDALSVFTIVKKQNITTLGDYLNNSKIAYCYYNHTLDEWSQPSTISNISIGSALQPVISSDGNSAVAVWTCDKDNNTFTINDTVTYASFWDNGIWHDTRKISNESIVSYPISLSYKNGVAVMAYAVDMDGNLSTKDDREIFMTTFTSTQTISTIQLTNDNTADSSPSVQISHSIPNVVWVKEENNQTTLYYEDLNTHTPIEILNGNISNPQLVLAGPNNDEPIIGWKDIGVEGLFVTRLVNGEWVTKEVCQSNKTIDWFKWDYTNDHFSATYIEKDNASSMKHCNLISIDNIKPDDPNPPGGPLTGYVNTTYIYSCATSDNNSDQLSYLFDWGDGSSSSWIGPYNSSELAYASHNWASPGVYDIRVKTKDTFGLETRWSSLLTIQISGNTSAPDNPLDPFPFDGANETPLPVTLSCIVTDSDDNPLDVTFIWGKGEQQLGWNYSYNVSSGRRAELTLPSLELNTSYWWYVEAWNGFSTTRSKTWSFKTGIDTTPPMLEIIRPAPGYFYWDRHNLALNLSSIFGNIFQMAFILGKYHMTVMAFDNSSSINRVEYYVNDALMNTTSTYPYSWDWINRGINLYTLKVVAYDKSGNSATKLLHVLKIF